MTRQTETFLSTNSSQEGMERDRETREKTFAVLVLLLAKGGREEEERQGLGKH